MNKQIIKKLRTIKGWTQEQLAHFCNCNFITIIRVEKEGLCSSETLNALAAVFEVKTWQLIGKEN